MSSCASYVSRTHDIIDDVTRLQSRSIFLIDISPSIFQLERRSKAQNIGNTNGYIAGILNVPYRFLQVKTNCRGPKMMAISKFFRYQTQLQFELRYESIVPTCAKKYFPWWLRIDNVTGWPQSRPSTFLYKWNKNIFPDNYKTNKDIINKRPVHRYHGTMIIFS